MPAQDPVQVSHTPRGSCAAGRYGKRGQNVKTPGRNCRVGSTGEWHRYPACRFNAVLSHSLTSPVAHGGRCRAGRGVPGSGTAPLDELCHGQRGRRGPVGAGSGAGLGGSVQFSFAVLEAQPDSDRGQLVGDVVLKGVVPGKPSAEVGYWTAAHARGRGFAYRALEALTGWAFATLRADGLQRLDLLHQLMGVPAALRVRCVSGCRAWSRHVVLWPAAYPESPGRIKVGRGRTRLPRDRGD
ncbi:GNAT family N-acetyltransferase [Streptomyces acidicola]|uniref:GNAT family N-acetyltransferase n=1 Tax=Streptomyces acidicola TaxID=2596892 RepID=UPI0038003F82